MSLDYSGGIFLKTSKSLFVTNSSSLTLY